MHTNFKESLAYGLLNTSKKYLVKHLIPRILALEQVQVLFGAEDMIRLEQDIKQCILDVLIMNVREEDDDTTPDRDESSERPKPRRVHSPERDEPPAPRQPRRARQSPKKSPARVESPTPPQPSTRQSPTKRTRHASKTPKKSPARVPERSSSGSNLSVPPLDVLKAMTKVELIQISKDLGLGLKNVSKLTKDVLIQSVDQCRNSQRDADQEPKKEKNQKKNNKPDTDKFNGVTFESKTNEVWQIGTQIGKGGCGAVYYVKKLDPCSDEEYAIKLEPIISGQSLTVTYESNILRKLKGNSKNHILPFIAYGKLSAQNCSAVTDVEYYYLVTPLMDIALNNLNLVDHDEQAKMCEHILIALKYLHSFGYSHNDVKPENIMKKNDVYYLIDFGMCTRLEKENKAVGGTIDYMPLDAHEKIQRFERRNDIESLLYTIAESFVGKLPWKNEKKESAVKKQKQVWLENCVSENNGRVKMLDKIFEELWKPTYEIN
jgi:RIO-like serine/threonine protein kinase